MHEPHDNPRGTLADVASELRQHVPFTIFGALTGAVIAAAFVYGAAGQAWAERLFQVCHPLHVFLSALVTTGMYRMHGRRGLVATVLVGYVGSVGIGTLSDCLVPYLGELLLGAYDEHVHAEVHLGFIEEWYLVNPLALIGIAIACWRPTTKVPHAGHVLLSTWASLFHMLMAVGPGAGAWMVAVIPVFLFLAVLVPCCTSDIVFPLLLARAGRDH